MKDTSLGMKIALLIMLIAFGYLTAVTFIDMPAAGAEHSKTIVGFLLGTIFSTLINYYWGNSSKNQTSTLSPTEEAAKTEAAKLESERIEAAKCEAAKAEAIRIEQAKIKASEVIEEAKKDCPEIKEKNDE
jgi:hypothetical protein